MKYRETIVTLKNGDRCLLRSPNAEEILQHLIQTSAETNNMVRYADEIVMTTEQERDYLASVESDPRSMMISALINGKIIANAGFNPVVPYERCRNQAEFGISIKKFFWEIGVGSAVLSAVIESAKIAGYEQLELEVVADNKRGIALYQKFGFQIYGTREKSFRYRDGSYAAEHLMLLKL